MLKINLGSHNSGEAYFIINIGHVNLYTSKEISNLFNLNLDIYNKLRMEKVIKHKNLFSNSNEEDIIFYLNGTDKETYLNRFKESFADKLTLLALN